jgi:hypothetical protein
MSVSPIQALQAAVHTLAPKTSKPDLLIAGATGVLGNAVMQRLVGTHRYEHTLLLAREPMQQGMRTVSLLQVDGEVAQWPALAQTCEFAVVMFEPPRMFYERERAMWTPQPEQLLALASWLKTGGAQTLAIVLPHAQGTLPEALKQGLASLNEHAIASLGFERLIIVRSAQQISQTKAAHPLQALANWMMGIVKYMIPSQEQPVRASKLAELVDVLLQMLPPGIHVVGPEQVWLLSQLPQEHMAAKIQAQAGHTPS